MIQVKEMTREEKAEMYMKFTKRELVEMLITSNEMLEKYGITYVPPAESVTTWTKPFDNCQ